MKSAQNSYIKEAT